MDKHKHNFLERDYDKFDPEKLARKKKKAKKKRKQEEEGED